MATAAIITESALRARVRTLHALDHFNLITVSLIINILIRHLFLVGKTNDQGC